MIKSIRMAMSFRRGSGTGDTRLRTGACEWEPQWRAGGLQAQTPLQAQFGAQVQGLQRHFFLGCFFISSFLSKSGRSDLTLLGAIMSGRNVIYVAYYAND